MDKYVKVEKPKETSPEEEIRVTVNGKVANYVTYAARLFNEMNHETITVRATGRAMTVAVCVAEVVKRRFKGLHQVTSVGCTEILDEYEPREEGLDNKIEKRQVAFVSILLTKNETVADFDAPGYQPPLDESLVKELDPEAVGRGHGRSRGRGSRGGYSGGRQFGRGRGGRGRGGRGGYGGDDRSPAAGGGYEGQRSDGSPSGGGGQERGGRGGLRRGRGRGYRGNYNNDGGAGGQGGPQNQNRSREGENRQGGRAPRTDAADAAPAPQIKA
eukprot:Selendium_serpulae@DN2954_c0_g1_i1.p1